MSTNAGKLAALFFVSSFPCSLSSATYVTCQDCENMELDEQVLMKSVLLARVEP